MKLYPNFLLVAESQFTEEFTRRGINNFHAALEYIWSLPYGRNSNRADFNLVLKENRGTCSTKHALLAAIARENRQPMFLTLGIYEMNDRNTPGVGAVLREFDLESLPEAHCFLVYENGRIDVTRSNEPAESIEKFSYEERIAPEQIGDYKIKLHREFFQKWMLEKNLNRRFDFDELWQIREKCINAITRFENQFAALKN